MQEKKFYFPNTFEIQLNVRKTLYYNNTRNYRSQTNIKNTFLIIAINISIIYRPDLLSSDEIKLTLFWKQNTSYIHKLLNRRSDKKNPSINRVWFCIQQLWVHHHKHVNFILWFLIRIQAYQLQYLNSSNIGTYRNTPTLSSCNYNVKNRSLFSCMNTY